MAAACRKPTQTPTDPPADTVFEIEIGLVLNDENIDFRGPYVHGPKGDRFLYMVWGALKPDDNFERFARAKLMLNDIPQALLPTAAEVALANGPATGSATDVGTSPPTLVCTMQATNSKGHPASGTLREPAVSWS